MKLPRSRQSSRESNGPRRLDSILRDSGIDDVDVQSTDAVRESLRRLMTLLDGLDAIDREVILAEAMARLERRGLRNARSVIGAVMRVVAETAPPPDTLQGQALELRSPEPWPDEVGGAGLLTEIADRICHYVVLPKTSANAVALWIVHTYLIDGLFLSPILGIASPVKRCGKSTLLMLLDAFCLRAALASSITPATLFRTIEKHRPTLLIDEGETFLTQNQELRGILNAGHSKKTAVVHRSAGDQHEPRSFRTFCAKAIALIGQLPGTLEDRAILIQMRRRARGEAIAEFRQDRIDNEVLPLRQRAMRWAMDHSKAVASADPSVPALLNDRARDNWRPLLAIADEAGGDWPALAREAAAALATFDDVDNTDGVALLGDIREIFETWEHDKIRSGDLVARVGQRLDRPWATFKRGKPLTELQCARLLKPFGISPKKLRIGDRAVQGYELNSFDDAFRRYLTN